MKIVTGKYSTATIFTDLIEQTAIDQIKILCDQPFVNGCKIAIMPDVHSGAGCVIGFTANLGDLVIPNIVGVDIGCGMLTVNLGKIDIDFDRLDNVIRTRIPSGMNVHDYYEEVELVIGMNCFNKLRNVEWIYRSGGTLGGGNHFIEIDKDDEDNKYLVIHTGSRNLGKQVADIYQNIAIKNRHSTKTEREKLILRLKQEGREQEIATELNKLKANDKIPKELCYLEGKDREDYLDDMYCCQLFAHFNRMIIATIIADNMGWKPVESFETVHNYIDRDSNIIRKGAVSAKLGEKLLIPMNMRDGSLICIGKGNPDWNYSAPHGAGRLFSRTVAKQNFSMNDYISTMEGIYTTSVCEDTLDECPMTYKPMESIIEAIRPTVDIIKIIKPIYNFKASK